MSWYWPWGKARRQARQEALEVQAFLECSGLLADSIAESRRILEESKRRMAAFDEAMKGPLWACRRDHICLMIPVTRRCPLCGSAAPYQGGVPGPRGPLVAGSNCGDCCQNPCLCTC